MSEDLRIRLDECRVSIAARGQKQPDGKFLEPRLWDKLRRRLQAQYRNATGEEFATLSVQPHPADEGSET